MKKFTLEEMKTIVEGAPEGSYWYQCGSGMYCATYYKETLIHGWITNNSGRCTRQIYSLKPLKFLKIYQLSKLKRLIQKEEQPL